MLLFTLPDVAPFAELMRTRQAMTPAFRHGFWSARELTTYKRQRRGPMAQKLFIGGLAFSTSTERLREAFSAAGQVESAAVVTDRDTGRSRGFGFVEMSTAEEADQAIAQFNGKDLDGRQLRVEKASAGGSRSGGGGASRGFGGNSRRW
jgi:hypothetical protein